MDFESMKNVMKFFNWELIGAISLMILAWTQLLKRYIPEICCVGRFKIPVVVLAAFASGFIFAHFIFDLSKVNHTETVALFHGFAGTLFALLGYEVVRGTALGLRSSAEIKENQPKP